MTAKQLIEDLKDFPPDMEVYLASDAEGNHFAPLWAVGRGQPTDAEENDDAEHGEDERVLLWPE